MISNHEQELIMALEKILVIAHHAYEDPKLRSGGARALKRCADTAEKALQEYRMNLREENL